MSKPRVYVETTIPSAYYTARNDPAMAARQAWTRRWLHQASAQCELVTSPAVMREILNGRSRQAPVRMALLEGMELLHVSSSILATAEMYIQHKVMPSKPPTDALHLALASHGGCDFLVTWNYRRLANPHEFDRIRRLNLRSGLNVPVLTTPRQLLGEGDEEEARCRSAPGRTR